MDLNSFLHQHLVKNDSNAIYTHTSLKGGKYNIPQEDLSDFYDLLYDTIYKKNIPVHIVEVPQEITNLKIDLDFKYPYEDTSRKYTLDIIKGMVELYNKAINTYLEVDENKLKAFVFERDAPYKVKGNTKDGIHIIYPDIICSVKIQHFIRDYVLEYCAPILAQLNNKQDYSQIIDKSVISSNGWLVYGCSKPTIKPYKLTHIFNKDLDDLNIKKYTPRDLMPLLKIRDHCSRDGESGEIGGSGGESGGSGGSGSVVCQIKDSMKHLLHDDENLGLGSILKESDINRIKRNYSSRIVHNSHYQASPINLENVRDLVKLLSVERADDYVTWIEVGLCLHNISPCLLDAWIDFSQKSNKGKTCRIFESTWASMKSINEGGIGIGSLHLWAKLDNPEEYHTFKQSSIYNDIMKSLSLTIYDVAVVVHKMYEHQFRCTIAKNSTITWYEFQNHRWRLINGGVSLRNKISKEVVNEYLRLINYFSGAACERDDDLKDKYIEYNKQLTEVTYKLRDWSYKDKLMKQCADFFNDPTFESRLDSNPDLICFENGVYDLANNKFRDGCPEDCISMSTSIDYETFSETDENIELVFKFMAEVFPDSEVKEYMLTMLGSLLEGRNSEEKFYIWTGVGGNGKSKLIELLNMTLGDYCARVPTQLFTQKRGSASQPNPELVRLRGVRAANSQETEESEKFNIAVLKEWCGGDNIICRGLFSNDMIEYKPQFKQIFCCNDKPILPSDDTGIWRRIIVIDFLSRFVDNPDPNNPYEHKRDYQLSDKFHSMKQAFIYILLQYYTEVYKVHGLVEPLSVKASCEEYRMTNDEISEFKNDRLIPDIQSSIKITELYKVYAEWWKINISIGKIIDKNKFKDIMEKKLGKRHPVKGWVGWKIVDVQNNETSETVIESTPLMLVGKCTI
jgi:P4 family phage/plasmid primase-like protien